MVSVTEARRLADAIERERTEEAQWPPPPPGGWEHLPVALVDTAFSLQARYSRGGEVFGPVRRYAEWAAEQIPHFESDELLAGIRPEPPPRDHRLEEMLVLLEPLSSDGRVEVFGNRRPAFTQPGAPRRADVVVMAAYALAEAGIQTRQDFERDYTNPGARAELRTLWLRIPGFGKRSWEYIPMLCGLPGVKADVHVTRFVGNAIDDGHVTPEKARELVYAATDELRRRDWLLEWTPGGVEHFIWRIASGQPPRSSV